MITKKYICIENTAPKKRLVRKFLLSLKTAEQRRLAVFGSYTKGEKKPESDTDIIQSSFT
ncbi:nucleotidyltransferase domain-containing protein [Methanosarcina barkeri]|uniref:nucleotidyltransferase domain-containing protein n=1 Tax=Methanosarcina barkeri TaxID=2208 RepID=UPI0006D10B8D|nr:nucleotidyltransferase domain-containing protein [Methanosarcina barkeri]